MVFTLKYNIESEYSVKNIYSRTQDIETFILSGLEQFIITKSVNVFNRFKINI